MPKPTSIDDYLSRVEGPERAALVKLRKTIHSLLPGAVECISYSIPAFRHAGHVVAGFLATKRGCSYFPFSGTTLTTLAPELGSYGQTKSALHFDAERPLPATLVKKLLTTRIAELGPSAGSRTSNTRPPKVRRTAPRSAKAQKAPETRASKTRSPKRRIKTKR